ncbi:MAG: hypothetical protein HOW73_37125 [Polyangiaceae bacterium]|nr:hypothetical protein [Polyangiaceae bacterium]
MRPMPRSSFLFGVALIALGCSAAPDPIEDGGGPSTGGTNNTGGTAQGGDNTGNAPSQGGTGGTGGSTANFVTSSGGGGEGQGGAIINPCGTGCGPEEICDGPGKGIDDDCDYEVDEGCPCSAGQASSCFKGDSSFLASPGCNPGTMYCTELGTWGPCVGGNHATPEEQCASANPQGCHPINAVPFATTDLSSGAGNFDDNADPGSETYTVSCPAGVNPCPTPNGTDYTALQSGEYEVTYTKEVGGAPQTCTFPLYVGARGLRVELTWNFTEVQGNVDLDLHMKQPMSTLPWVIFGDANQDCGYGNCKASSFNAAPVWFPAGNVPPDPVNFYTDPVYEANSCYYAPDGEGAQWQAEGGCRSPRLDADNISCTPSETDPTSGSYCAPENINIDFPPKNEWIRIGVHHYSNFYSGGNLVKPNVKIFCDGQLASDLGPVGFASPIQWSTSHEDNMWLVADVLFREDECVKECIVQPLYSNDQNAPVDLTTAQHSTQNGPPYPPLPQ